MRKTFFLLPVLFISCYSLERDCNAFHEGEFKFTQIVNGEMKSSFFTRDANYEIERYEGKIDTATIRWVNDCECILTKLNPTSNQDNRYTFEYSLVGDPKNKQRGTIEKIN
ncbi:hypothetical protein N9L50_05735 [Flavobacteriaceae bacterium]|nr:hypothetical protein [Flavobacteriaceae bacterium]